MTCHGCILLLSFLRKIVPASTSPFTYAFITLIKSTPIKAALMGFMIMQAIGVLELIFIALSYEASLSDMAWVLTFGVTVSVPLSCLVAAVSGWFAHTWRLTSLDPKAPTSSACLLLGIPVTALTLILATLVGPSILGSIRTSWMAGLCLTLVVMVSATLIAVLIAPLGTRLITRVQHRVAWLERPTCIVLGLLMLGLFAGLSIMALKWDLVRQTPWWTPLALLSAPLLISALSAGVSRLESRLQPRYTRALAAIVAVSLLGLSAISYLGVLPYEDAMADTLEPAGIIPIWTSSVRAQMDSDGDGESTWLGEHDCAPGDSSIYSAAYDEPGDGIDQNCNGEDARDLVTDIKSGHNDHDLSGVKLPRRPHIIMISTDALGLTHTGIGGYERDVTPHLDAMTKRATTFTQAFSTGPSTRLAMPGILLGKYNALTPLDAKRRHPYGWRNEGNLSMAEMLDEQGWRTVQVLADTYFTSRTWPGLSQGFKVVNDAALTGLKKKPRHNARQLTDEVISQIDQHKSSHKNEPLFLWAHYFDHHGPYQQPEDPNTPKFGDEPVDIYDAELHATDAQWGRLFAHIEKTWEPDEYILIFTSDHGESFQGRHHHGYSLRTEVLDVPLIIQTEARRGERVEGLVTHMDLMPTLAALSEYTPKTPIIWHGESLLPSLYIEDATPKKDYILSLFYLPEKKEDAFTRISLRTQDHYLVHDIKKRRWTWYTWADDKLDTRAKRGEPDERQRTLRAILERDLNELRTQERGLKTPELVIKTQQVKTP